MPDIKILTLDKIGKGLNIDPNSGNLDLKISEDPRNALKVNESTRELFVNGFQVEIVPDANTIVWLNADLTYPGIQSGMSDLSNPLQIGKDLLGNIWIRGALTNVSGGTISPNTEVATIPVDSELSGYQEAYDFYQLSAIQSSLAGNTTALFLRFREYNYKQSIAFSGNWVTNVSFIIQTSIIGRAKYAFRGAANSSIPNHNTVTWAAITITNANISNGLSDGSNPMQIGRDPEGNLWMRGAVTNTGTAVAANGVIGTLPVDYQLAGVASVNSFIQLTAIQSNLAGNTTALFLRLKNYNNVQSLAFSGSLATNVSFIMQPTIIGRVKT